MTNWLSAAASVIGTGHATSGAPCQDAHCCIQRDDGRWLAMVVSDGAGTARYSDQGSNLVANSFAHALIELSNEIEHRNPGAWINDFVIGHILTTRNELRNLAKSDNLKDYHCTLVACLVGETGGFLIHIGDGAAFGASAMPIGDEKYSLSELAFSSLPENGEYSNETFFITEGDWIKHLRITPIPSVDWIMLGTDGGTSLAMVADKEPKPGFVVPLLTSLALEADHEIRNEKLAAVLSDAQADKLTSDDKTICFAFRQRLAVVNKTYEMNTPSLVQPANRLSTTTNSTNLTSVVDDTTQPILHTCKRKCTWKRQITRKVIVSAFTLVFLVIVVCWANLNPEVLQKCINLTKGMVNEVLGSAK